MSKEKADHLAYIGKKQEKSIKLFNEQMVKGKIFTETPFEKIDELKEDFSDLEKEKGKREIKK